MNFLPNLFLHIEHHLFMKQVGLVCVPLLECLRGCFVVQVFLRDVVIIQVDEAFEDSL